MSPIFAKELDQVDLLVPAVVVEDDNWLELGLLVGFAVAPDELLVVLENGLDVALEAGHVLPDFVQGHGRTLGCLATRIANLG